jgi:predicted anti-sigma-YlaC factor YlaD
MTCSQARLALSARLDGENPGVDPSGLATHLDGCAGCRSWLAGAERLRAAVPVALPAEAAPDLTVAVLSRLATDRRAADRRAARARERTEWALRLGLAGFAAVQLLLALPGILGVAGAHAHHEVTAFAVAFLLAAFRPALARAYAPVGLVLAGCLALSAVLDLAQGYTTLGHEAAHLLTVVPAAMLVALAYGAGLRPGRSRPEAGLNEVAVR